MAITINYLELNKKINTYMYNSGIKDYCRQKCQGSCCIELELKCFDTKKCDHSLPCSLFLCDNAEAEIINQVKNGEEIVDLLRDIDKIIRSKLNKMITKNNKYLSIYTQTHCCSVEFSIPDISILENPQRIEVR